MGTENFNVLEFLQQEISSLYPQVRMAAVNRCHLVATALGPQKTLNELVPYMISVIKEEPFCHDDEFLFSIANQYAVLSDFIDSKFDILIAPLEYLAALEETVIREQAIQSMQKIIEKKPYLAQDHLAPVVSRLATHIEFTARVSACALVPIAYKHCNEEQKQVLRTTYSNLCGDDTPMVRRASAAQLSSLIQVCEKHDLLEDIIKVYKQLAQEDTQDSIRVSCVHATLQLAQIFSAEENRAHTVSGIKAAAEDRSWRVRLHVVKSLHDLCKAFGPEITTSHLMASFVQLLKDNEQEVRKEAVRAIQTCLTQSPPALTTEHLQTHIMPQFQSLGVDSAQSVRAALAQVLGPVAKALGRDITQRSLLTLISDLMRDEFHDVRLNIVSHAGLICEVLSVDGLVHSLLHTIQSLFIDNHWRIRQSVVEQIPKLASLFGVELFQSKLEALLLSSLRDSVHSVRQAAVQNLGNICDSFGAQWTVDHLLPKIVEQYSQSAGYANRVTTLQILPQVARVMTNDQTVQYIIPLLVKATKDSVPNVRFCACQMVQSTICNKNLSSVAINNIVKPALNELEHDSDIDVQFYSQCALNDCK